MRAGRAGALPGRRARAAAQAAPLWLTSVLACLAGAWPGSAWGQALPASAQGPVTLAALRLPPGSRHERLGESVWLHGMPAQVLVFDAPQGITELIRFLSNQQPALADLNILPGQAILSGRVGHEQWVVQMEALGPRRTVGSVSSASPGAWAERPGPSWLPAGGRLRLDITVQDQGATVTERIWQYELPPERVAPRLEAGLERDGWRRPPSQDGPPWWTRGQARLRISLVPLEAGSGLLVSGWAP